MNRAETLFNAIEDGEDEVAIQILENSPNLANAMNQNGQTAFWWAASYNRTQVIELMLREPIRRNINFQKTDNFFRSPLDAAKAYNNREIITLLNPLYGVGVESKYLEDESNLSKDEPFLQRLKNNTKLVLFPKPRRYAVSFSILISLGLAITLVMFLFFGGEKSGERMIAQGGELNIKDAVTTALSDKSRSKLAFDALNEELRSQGWDGLKVSVSQAENKELMQTTICQVELYRGQKKETGTIIVESKNSKISKISSTMDKIRVSLKSTKRKIIMSAITHCF